MRKNYRHAWVAAVICLGGLFSSASYATRDAAANGEWISLGVPKYFHMGTDGSFYLNGTDEGSCKSVRPQYFRVDTNAPHWKEFYAMILSMAAQNKPIEACVVVTGCGQSEVWIQYCRGSLQ